MVLISLRRRKLTGIVKKDILWKSDNCLDLGPKTQQMFFSCYDHGTLAGWSVSGMWKRANPT